MVALVVLALFCHLVQVKKGLLKWFYPDAHDANENVKEGLDAYYDKVAGKWVFPGEVKVFLWETAIFTVPLLVSTNLISSGVF